ANIAHEEESVMVATIIELKLLISPLRLKSTKANECKPNEKPQNMKPSRLVRDPLAVNAMVNVTFTAIVTKKIVEEQSSIMVMKYHKRLFL
ncbi:MAG: hypothetical protein ACI9CO_000999, partial [Candidatus Azotimanducaceae bacterium]